MTDLALTGSLTWLAFLGVVAVLCALCPRPYRVRLLVAASLVYYGWGRPLDMLVVAELGLVTYLAGRRVRTLTQRGEDRDAKVYLALGVVTTVLTLGTFKYAQMAVSTANGVLNRLMHVRPFAIPVIAVPLGISFIAFGIIRFLVEMRAPDAPEPTPMRYALHVLFFPSVINGPIKGYTAFAEEMERSERPRIAEALEAIGRIIVGAGKKFVLAAMLGPFAAMLSSPWRRPADQLVIGMYAYTFMIYADFSGYSDMAIGGARLLGYRLPENFAWPYLQRNIAEFWGHWHMTLTDFITRYVFIPLGGSRTTRAKVARNTLVAMFVSGLWHGAAWHFVAWGVYHGIGLVVYRWYAEAVAALRDRSARFDALAQRRGPAALVRVLATLGTFHFVALGWVMFVLPGQSALHAYQVMFGWAGGGIAHAVRAVVGLG